MSDPSPCPLCEAAGGEVLWRDGRLRVILPVPAEAGHPGLLRVVWHEHVREMSDLTPAARAHLLTAVVAAEQVLRRLLSPVKVNLASLGNQVPHLHWHVIPRFADDPHFPGAIWAEARRPAGRALPPGFAETAREALAETLGPSTAG